MIENLMISSHLSVSQLGVQPALMITVTLPEDLRM